MDEARLTRRRLIELGLALPLPVLLGARAAGAAGEPALLPPTLACDDGDEPTATNPAGPFFRPRSPRRRSLLRPGVAGTTLILTGRVLTRGCTPIRGALLDFWQADARGRYDNRGYRFRGHQFTDRRGRYRLETVVPGLYPGRTRHIHVRVQGRGRPLLTTQLYFPGEPRNRSDGLFEPDLLVAWRGSGNRRLARFDFVLDD